MLVRPTPLPGLLVVEPVRHGDARGFFAETYHAERYAAAGVAGPFVQDNVSRSGRGTLRGLHAQAPPHAQGKLVSVLDGAVFDVGVDLRRGSPTFGQWYGEMLTAETGRQMFLPPGFAHGFVVTSETALFAYKCTHVYAPHAEIAVAWDDPDLAIDWPVEAPQLSAKDRAAPRWRDVAGTLPFVYEAAAPVAG